ncbi:MAG: fibronectin type III domain-containing protein, partial [Thermosipho sp. (in: Bacteria)]|nr:fibronectin type III domain-containing protein [Thermosipho sp. (in: thermotogales)]
MKKVKLALIIVFSITILILLFVFLPKLLNKPPNVPTNPTPGNNEKGVSIFPVLSWSASDPDGDKLLYDLYFGKDEELELLVSNLATNSYTTKKLEYGTTYNWRVVVKDERGNITEGPIWKFITNYLPNIPSNPSPEDGAIDVSTKPVLSWDASDPDGDKLLYDLYFGKNPHFEIPVISNYEKNQFETENLDFKTTYYWKIVAKDEKGGVRESPIWKFTTIKQNDPPYIPNNPSPVDGVTGQPINLELTWKSGDPDNDEVSYAIYFGEVGNLKKIVDDLKEAKYMLKNLKFGTMYNWKVVAKDGKGGISESPVWQFTTNYLPEVIDKPEPEDGASGVSTSPILRWEARDKDGDKLTYDVYLGKEKDLKLIASDLSTETYKVEGFENGEVYSWKVVVKDERGGVVEGPVWKFTTNYLPEVVDKPEPEDGASGVSTSPILRWEARDKDGDKLIYDVYFGEGEDLKLIASDLSTDTYKLEDLKFETTYYWKVVARDKNNIGVEGPIWQFTTNYLPEVIDKPEPEDGASGVSTSPILRWEARDKDGDKLTYDVYLGKGEDLKLIASDLSTETYKVEGLENGEVYSWKVVVKDERGGVVEGPVWKFTTNYLPEISNTPFPMNESTNVSLSTSLGWNSKDLDGDRIIYDIYFGKVNPPSLYKNNYEYSKIELEKLEINTTYYWQIVAKDERGGDAKGPIWSFTTTRAPEKPSNPLPVNNATGVEVRVSLNWHASDPDGDILLYDVYFGTNNNLLLKAKDYESNKFEVPEKLKEGTTYYWKVVAKDDKGGVTEGRVWSFTTNYRPNRPFNPTPKDGETNVSVNPVLTWQANDPDGDRLLYDVYFGTDNNIELILENYDKTSFNPGQLKENTTYYWKVVAKDEKGGRRESFFWSFTTKVVSSLPSKPSDPHPSDKEDNVSIHPILKWNASDPDGDTLIYDVYFGSEKEPPLVLENSKINYFDPGELLPNTTYYWKVVAKDGKGGISESPVWQFTTNYLPEVIDKPEPGDGASGVSTSPILRWEARDKDGDKLAYDVYLGKGKGLKLIASDLSTETYKVEGLENGEVYSWKVVVKDERGGVVEGPVWKFRTKDTLVQWQKIYGGSNNDIGYSIQKTSDNGYVIAGYTNSKDGDVKENKGEYDAWIVKLDNLGNIKWQRTFGGSGFDLAYSVESTQDNGYVIAGYTNSKDGDVKENKGEYDAWIVKLDNSGNIKWQRIFGGSNIDLAKSIKQTKDGGYIVVGWTTSIDKDIEQSHGLSDFWIIKLDENGEIVWQKVLGGSGQDMAESVALVEDGYIIV